MKLRILLSYWYYKNIDLEAMLSKYFTPPYPDIFADSGAYSAMTQGVTITCQEYAAWVKQWQHLFNAYANLDVIRDGQKTWENQQTLESLGLFPIPAFHVAEDFSWLERYVDTYPYIALGVAGMQAKKDAVIRWLVKCFEIAGGRSVFHGFALTSWNIMKSFPWYSVDSSSWGSGFRYGIVPLFNARTGRFEKIRLGDRTSCRKHASLVTELGFSILDFVDRSRNDRAKICAISALSYMKAEQWLQKRWGAIHIPGQPGSSPGSLTYLADGAPSRFYENGNTGIRLHLAGISGGNQKENDLALVAKGVKQFT